jgi:hypothetical protein
LSQDLQLVSFSSTNIFTANLLTIWI